MDERKALRLAVEEAGVGRGQRHIFLCVGGKCAAPLGAHGNVVKLISLAYGQVLSQLETVDTA